MRLAQPLGHALREDAAEDVGVAAGGEGHDHADRPVGIGGARGARQQARAGDGQ
jgi:hypothetical protein